MESINILTRYPITENNNGSLRSSITLDYTNKTHKFVVALNTYNRCVSRATPRVPSAVPAIGNALAVAAVRTEFITGHLVYPTTKSP
jgi:hypothetical protein